MATTDNLDFMAEKDNERNSCKTSLNGFAKNNNVTGGSALSEPSFQERYPEGRERLLALAESPKPKHQNALSPLSRRSSPFTRHSATPTCSTTVALPQTPVKPKMGLKDVRNRVGAAGRWDHTGASPAATGSVNNVVTMYSSEQSLPEKLSQAIKGGISAAFRGAGGSANHHRTSKTAGAVAADDVLYFSSSSNSAGSQGCSGGPVPFRQPKIYENNLNKAAALGGFSKSTEDLETRCQDEKPINVDQGKLNNFRKPETAVSIHQRPRNLMKVKDCSSYGMNLEDLKKLYRSLPDCSTSVNDDDDEAEMRMDRPGELDEYNYSQTRMESAADCDGVRKVAALRVTELQVGTSGKPTSLTPADVDDAHGQETAYNRLIVSCNGCIHHQQQDQLCSYAMRTPSDPAMQHGRQPSSDSSISTSDETRPKSSFQSPVPQPAQHRLSAPYTVDLRDSCGSPTDSGYRSVPRSDGAPDQQSRLTGLPPSGHSTVITSRTPLYTAVPKQTFLLDTARPQHTSDQSKTSDSATCNIVMVHNNGATVGYNCCVSNAASPGQVPGGRGDSSGRRQKVRPKHGSGHGIRMGGIQPPVDYQSNAVSRHSLDDRSGANAGMSNSNVCQSPYSELSSPNYGTSTTSSSGASSSAVRQASQHGNPNVHSGLVSKLAGASANTIGQQQQHNQSSTNGIGFDTINTNVSIPEEFSLERCPKLIELDRVPWNEKDIVSVLQKGRTRTLVNQIAIDVVPRLTYMLQRPLVRIAREAQRLCSKFNKCTKLDIQYAAKIILPSMIGDSCQKAALQATAMFMMSGESMKQSKSHRAGLRGLSVGKFQRWMCDAQLALCVLDQAAVYLTAVMENLLEEIVLQSMPDENTDMLTSECLEVALANNVELWGLLQPYSHLICSRTANGMLGLPHRPSSVTSRDGSTKSHGRRFSLQQQQQQLQAPKDCRIQHERNSGCGNNGTLLKNIEQCLLATCVGSTNELGELITRVLYNPVRGGSSPSLASLTSCANSGTSFGGKQSTLVWSKEAVRTLFYFMRCSQLEQSDNPHCSPPAVVLAHERPYLVLPPLIEWLRVSHAHTEHRQACVVDSDDVLQAARILLPGLDCPPRPFGLDDFLPVSDRVSPQTSARRLNVDLAYRMLTSGNLEQAAKAMGLLGSEKLNSSNEQGLTPLMWACLQGDEAAVRILLDAGVGVNVNVPIVSIANQQKSSLVLLELTGWTALTFAVAQRNCGLCQLLLEKGATVESAEMCSETPLQIAAMMGHHDLVNVLMSRGADPFYATITSDAGFKQRGCASPLSLAACHGHRTVLQAMFSRRRGRSEEVLSLEDFLAEGLQTPAGKIGQSDKSQMPLNNQQPANATASSWLGKLTKSQQKVLQDAMYQAAECGHLDITMDLRHLGIPWNTHTWTQTLSTAYDLCRKALVQLLLSDFIKYRLDDVNQEFVDQCLPLLFEIFRQSKNEVSTGQLADIFAYLYGPNPIPEVGGVLALAALLDENRLAPRIDAKYVNNPDLSDVQFLIDGRIFYGHKIVLINGSDRFKRLLQEGSSSVEVNGVRYEIFQLMMEFLYNGKPTVNENNSDLTVQSQLLRASCEFELRPLQLHCESLMSSSIDVDNCVDIYRFALHNGATELMRYCEGYFLQNLPTLINRVDGYRRLMACNNHSAGSGLLVSSSSMDLNKSTSGTNAASNAFDLADALLQTLTERLQQRGQHQCKKL